MSYTDADIKSFYDPNEPDGAPKVAPVLGYPPGIPWSVHLKAYEVYAKKYGHQYALIDLHGRGCRGGFGVRELDEFTPGWRDDKDEVLKLRAEVTLYREVAQEMLSDHMTSEEHHPGYVLVPTSSFEKLKNKGVKLL